MYKVLIPFLLAVSTTFGASIGPKGLIPRLDGKIVGGVATTIKEYPHQISLRYYGSHRCGGSIFKADVIITACHCTIGIAASNLNINAGTTYRTVNGPVSHSIKKIIEHEDYDGWTYVNDISIMFLEEELSFTDEIQPIPLANAGEQLKAGTMVRVTGWGTLQSGGMAPDELQVVYVSTVGREECEKAYEEMNEIDDSMLCAGEQFGGKDSCQGDSGGPLICNGKQYGIVSWGYGCAFPDYPGVYSNIAYLRPWIDLKVKISLT